MEILYKDSSYQPEGLTPLKKEDPLYPTMDLKEKVQHDGRTYALLSISQKKYQIMDRARFFLSSMMDLFKSITDPTRLNKVADNFHKALQGREIVVIYKQETSSESTIKRLEDTIHAAIDKDKAKEPTSSSLVSQPSTPVPSPIDSTNKTTAKTEDDSSKVKQSKEKSAPASPKFTYEKAKLEVPSISPTSPTSALQPLNMQDVTDDGSCMLYAIAIGLKKQCAARADVQAKLRWDISEADPLLQKPSLKKEKALDAPGARLRELAVEYVNLVYIEKLKSRFPTEQAFLEFLRSEERNADPIIQNSLDYDTDLILSDILHNAIPTYQQVVQRKIDNAKNLTQLPLNVAELEGVIKDIEIEESRQIAGNNQIEKYLERCRSKDFYFGPAQIIALSDIFQVPIVLWKPFIGDVSQAPNENLDGVRLLPRVVKETGKPDKVFVPTIYGRNFTGPAVQIAHVNENHFQFVNS